MSQAREDVSIFDSWNLYERDLANETRIARSSRSSRAKAAPVKVRATLHLRGRRTGKFFVGHGVTFTNDLYPGRDPGASSRPIAT